MRFFSYVFYVNRLDLLERSIGSFSELHSKLIVIDNSISGDIPVFPKDVGIYRPPVPLTYAQSMNLILSDALKNQYDAILHFHSDAYTTNPNAVQELLAFVETLVAKKRKWACAWTLYDILWAINPLALSAIGGWDTRFSDYFGDNDARRRWELAGWECLDTGIQGIHHEGSATINSDKKLQFLNSRTFPLYAELYRQKHGGSPGNESLSHPYGQEWLSWKP